MAINTVVTRGYGNGTYTGTIALVSTRGYAIGDAAETSPAGTIITQLDSRTITSALDSRTIVTQLDARTITTKL